MELLKNSLYLEDVQKVASMPFPWEKLQNKSILISGASGMIGSFLIDVIEEKNPELNCTVYALGRNAKRAQERFAKYWNTPCFHFISGDINETLHIEAEKIDFIFHAASNTHPVAYATEPISTILTNIIGTRNLLELAHEKCAERFVFASSVEVYGENRGDCEKFTEDYCGYLDCNTLRAGYPESKRAGEALCQAYIRQKGLDIVIPRLSRTYGPTMLQTDTKAISQFIKKGVAHEDIVLKSEGTQLYSYSYVADAVSGVLTTLFSGRTGEAYNIADSASDITLRDLAGIIASESGKQVIFELPDAVELAGYSKATLAVMSGEKLRTLGWKPLYDIKNGLERTISILRSVK